MSRRRARVQPVWSPSQWMELFNSVLDRELDYDDQWSLNFNYSLRDKLTPEERKKGWKVHSSCTHADFECGSCHKTWHSAKSLLLVHYRLRGNRGTVIMRPFGQACRSCREEDFNRPGFLDREVKCFLLTLSRKILKNCYRVVDVDDNDLPSRNTRRTNPHEASLCEACTAGILCGDVRDREQDCD